MHATYYRNLGRLGQISAAIVFVATVLVSMLPTTRQPAWTIKVSSTKSRMNFVAIRICGLSQWHSFQGVNNFQSLFVNLKAASVLTDEDIVEHDLASGKDAWGDDFKVTLLDNGRIEIRSSRGTKKGEHAKDDAIVMQIKGRKEPDDSSLACSEGEK